MKIYQDILGAKLQELEQQYEHLRNRLQICEGEDPGQIHQELESAKKEYDTLQLRLRSTVETSRSPAVSRLAKVQLAYSTETEKLLKEQVAGEAGVPFFSMSGSEFVEMFVGMGASKVRDLFKQAKEKAPCIVFIDEIDAIGQKRDGRAGGNDEREQTLNQLLTEMDGFEENTGVMILAATNRPESLDPALTRPGRFDRRVPVELPNLQGREAILRVHAKKVNLSDNIDFKKIARMASGASGAELANIVNETALRAVRDNREYVTQADLEESIEVVIAGYQKKISILTDQEKKGKWWHITRSDMLWWQQSRQILLLSRRSPLFTVLPALLAILCR